MGRSDFMLYGAIIGDIAGSKYEFNNIKWVPVEIMDRGCFFTDDTVMTIAIADALTTVGDENFRLKMLEWGNAYPGRGYGASFNTWLKEHGDPYYSFGNGSAMRVSAIPYACENLDQVADLAKESAIPTHDHPEGIKGAQAVACAIWLAYMGYTKAEIKEYVEYMFKYKIKKCDEIRLTYQFNETCQDTVPQAISAFMDSDNFEDAIKLAISLGGDSDTLAAITGSIAEAFYGIPDRFIIKCRALLPTEMLRVIDRFEDVYKRR